MTAKMILTGDVNLMNVTDGRIPLRRVKEKLLAADRVAEISLVSHDNFFLFTPMLHEIAASDLEITNIVNPLRKLLRKVNVVVANVHHIELAAKRVVISRESSDYLQQIGYDHLVIALGSVTNFHDLAGVAELAVPMKSLSDAIRLRAQVLRHLEEANSECDHAKRRSLLTFVVAGGGFAGVETVASLMTSCEKRCHSTPTCVKKCCE